MFRFASWSDWVLIVIGTIAALANGSTRTLNMLILGDLFDTINFDTSGGTNPISAKAIYFVYIAIGTFICSTLQVLCFTIISENITIRVRQLYLQSVLSQDIAFFDVKNSGELASSVAENSLVFREAIGDKLGNTIHFLVQ
jgi:ATP-binding cassette subfamily B (MDR/TAP) protein 1